MNSPSADANYAKPRRSLLNNGGPRRIIKNSVEADSVSHIDANMSTPFIRRADSILNSRKRTLAEINPVIESRLSIGSEFLEAEPSCIKPIVPDRESKRTSIASSKSSLSGEMNVSTPSTDGEQRFSDHALPKNLQNRIVVNQKSYIKLKQIGTGGSCIVYKVLDERNEILALKCVNLANVSPSQYSDFVNEVKLLEELCTSPGIIKMIDHELNPTSKMLFILMECGETDLKSYLENIRQKNLPLDINFIRLIWQQMLTAVHIIHQHHIIHSDLKPSNFVFVKGYLKLIDFGIAREVPAEATSILRDSQVGTINYISPEALIDQGINGQKSIRIRRSSDVWSLGCILYQMIYQRSPWGTLSLAKKILAITRDSFQIPFPVLSNPWLLDVIQSCLQRDPIKRPTIDGNLGLFCHPFLEPHGSRAMMSYKQNVIEEKVMKEVIRQVQMYASDERWKLPGIIPLFTNELVIQCARNKSIDVIEALRHAQKHK